MAGSKEPIGKALAYSDKRIWTRREVHEAIGMKFARGTIDQTLDQMAKAGLILVATRGKLVRYWVPPDFDGDCTGMWSQEFMDGRYNYRKKPLDFAFPPFVTIHLSLRARERAAQGRYSRKMGKMLINIDMALEENTAAMKSLLKTLDTFADDMRDIRAN